RVEVFAYTLRADRMSGTSAEEQGVLRIDGGEGLRAPMLRCGVPRSLHFGQGRAPIALILCWHWLDPFGEVVGKDPPRCRRAGGERSCGRRSLMNCREHNMLIDRLARSEFRGEASCARYQNPIIAAMTAAPAAPWVMPLPGVLV